MVISFLIALPSFIVIVAATTTPTEPPKVNRIDYVQTSPAWLSHIKGPSYVATGYPFEDEIKSGPLPKTGFKLNLRSYPEPNKQPPINHPEVQAVLKQLDLSKVGTAPPRIVKDWVLDITHYPAQEDPDCWWSASLCKKPKISYIPEDISFCPNKGDWGLNYDDGPYKFWYPTTELDKKFDQPRFYNFLVDSAKKQKATLFFVGSNVIKFPIAAQRALGDGHTICSHTWSHPQMTSLTNEEVVAQLYWTQKAIKESLGITPKCWRPPYGDVDDRVRAIAWQMGMRTILWDQDSNDWNLFVMKGKGHLKPEVIDAYFKTWIKNRAINNDTEHGHITLQHENSNATILISEKWLPELQKSFNVMPIHKCINDAHPYWEESWVYPTLDTPDPTRYHKVDPPISKYEPGDDDDDKLYSGTSHVFISSSVNAIIGLLIYITIGFL